MGQGRSGRRLTDSLPPLWLGLSVHSPTARFTGVSIYDLDDEAKVVRQVRPTAYARNTVDVFTSFQA